MSKIQPTSLKKYPQLQTDNWTIDKVPQESFLVTMDIRLLYNNIPNNVGIKAVEATLKIKNFKQK